MTESVWPELDLREHADCLYVYDGLMGTPVKLVFLPSFDFPPYAMKRGSVLWLVTLDPYRFPVEITYVRPSVGDVGMPDAFVGKRVVEAGIWFHRPLVGVGS